MEAVVGTYSGSGYDHGCAVSITLTILEKKLAWMDFRSDPPEAGARPDQWHSEGRYTIETKGDKQILCYEIGGLPGQGRTGQVYNFEVVCMEGPPRSWSFKAEGNNAVLISKRNSALMGDDVSSLICFKCSEMILGPSVSTKSGQVFHPSCMVCDQCNKSLAGLAFQVVDGRRLCPGCTPKVRCYACNLEITGKKTKVLDKFYHPECFKCHACGVALSGGFLTKGDAVLCSKECVTALGSGKTAPPAQVTAPSAAEEKPPAAPAQIKVTPAAPSRPDPPPLPLGQYTGKQSQDGTDVSYAIQLMKHSSAWLDYTSATKIATSTWHAEGTYSLVWSDPNSDDFKLVFVVDACPHSGGGPKKGESWELPVRSSGAVLECKGIACQFQAAAQPAPQEKLVPEKKQVEATPSPAPATAAAPAPAPAPAPEAAPAPTPAPAPAPAALAGDGDTLTLEELKNADVWRERGVDPSRREDWLSDSDFQTAFGMSKSAFQALPKWKRDGQKRALGLF